jgi:bifunctional non-homologous end joining protein LigD
LPPGPASWYDFSLTMTPTRKPEADKLGTYRAKRSADRTPEPSGAVAEGGGRLFVVHKHAATRLHFDLRLEMGGVLESWAVPKGPSRNPADKRLAVKVEDHPLEYGDFEGVIPEGNYGAGAVVLWDRGVWVPVEDVEQGFEKGKLLFELRGYKLRGRWTLVKIKKSEKEWLLIKERDALVSEDGDDFPQDSVLSGLTVDELLDGGDRTAPLAADLEEAGAKLRSLAAQDVKPMLAQSREKPFSKAGWLFEIKYDGYRMIAGLEQGEARLVTRNGHDATPAVRAARDGRRSGGPRRVGPAQLPAAAEARAAHPAGRHPQRFGRAACDALSVRPGRPG